MAYSQCTTSSPNSLLKNNPGFAQQMDLHDGTGTVRAALQFSALLRQPKSYSQKEKLAYADKILNLLDLMDVQHARQEQATAGQQLCLGKVVNALPSFARHGALYPEGANPGEFILETVGAGVNARMSDKSPDWAAIWAPSDEAASLGREIQDSKNGERAGRAPDAGVEDGSDCNTSISTQYWHKFPRPSKSGPSHAYGWVAFASSTIVSEIPGSIIVTGVVLLEMGFSKWLVAPCTRKPIPSLGAPRAVHDGPKSRLGLSWICPRLYRLHLQLLYYLSPFTYVLGGMVTTVTTSVSVSCRSSELTIFTAPPNETCSSYASERASSVSALLLNPDAPNDVPCEVCRWTPASQFLAQFNPGDGQLGGIWGCWAIFVDFTVGNFVLVYFFTWATKVKGWKFFNFF
ncbi:hypothetical protein B0T10DRAFT_465970 [Thelonectria olida]|uniref:Uncharacterized protein n=1 Tax=Thelonectria olida TaxID=1576542 RepID=A0A9P8VSI5_9HYPO|nr:hypothetical protein B0T10DRAFT_465970 [Thelonectria olida]